MNNQEQCESIISRMKERNAHIPLIPKPMQKAIVYLWKKWLDDEMMYIGESRRNALENLDAFFEQTRVTESSELCKSYKAFCAGLLVGIDIAFATEEERFPRIGAE